MPLDLRKDRPYSGYEQYEFDVPVGTKGDCYDRYLCRGEEMRQSVRIIKQAIKNFPGGDWYAKDAKRIFAPPKDKILTSMEELIQNFMLVTEGPQMPPGEVYFEAENPKGALGFLRGLEGRRGAVAAEDPQPLVLQSQHPAEGLRRRDARRHRLHPRLVRLRDGGMRPVRKLRGNFLMNLKPETLQKIDEVIAHYPVKRSAALPLLHLVQEDQGYISPEAIEWIAAKLELQPINIYELVTFYPMFRQKPVGRRHIKVCRTLSCALVGGYAVVRGVPEAIRLRCRGNLRGRRGDRRVRGMPCELRHRPGRDDRRRAPRTGRRRPGARARRTDQSRRRPASARF